MKESKIFFICSLAAVLIGCHKQNQLPQMDICGGSNNSHIISKIGYLFYYGGESYEFFPAKSFDISNIYAGLNTQNIEDGFQQFFSNSNSLEYNSLLASMDTFIIKSTNLPSQTIRILPAFIEYKKDSIYSINNTYKNHEVVVSELNVLFNNRNLKLKAYFRYYRINRIVPLSPLRTNISSFLIKDTITSR